LRKLIAIVIAAVVVAAAGIGIGFAAFPKTPLQAGSTAPVDNTQSPNTPSESTQSPTVPTASEDVSDSNDEINSLDNIPGYVGLVDLGYSDVTARYLSSVKLDMISSNHTYYHYVQTTPNGTRSETILSYSPNEQFDTTGHQKITVTPGFDIYAKNVKVEKLDQGYHVVISYFIPNDSTPYDLEEYLNPVQPVSSEFPLGIQYASAAGTLIFGTGVALDSTVITPIESANTVASPPRITAAPVEDVGGTLQRQATADTAREVQQMIMDRDAALQEVASEVVPRQSQTADRITRESVDQAIRDQIRQERIDLRRVADRAAREEAAETLSRTSGRVVTGLATAWSLYNILDDHFRISGSIDAARDCYNNPTNPLARDAQRNDPHYGQLGENLDTAQEGLYVTTGARVGVQGFETAAGASTGFAGGLALGSVSQGMDAMLWNSQMSEISDALSGITPCTPCPEDSQNPPESPPQPEGDHTPGPNEPGFYYTPGPREWYEPQDRRQTTCRPVQPNQVTLSIHEVVEEGEGTPRVVTFQGTANVTMTHYSVGNLIYYTPDFFSGNGTGTYHENIRYIQQNRDYLWCNVEIQGTATMEVLISRHKSGLNMSLAEVSISIVGPLPITQDPPGCFNDKTTTEDGIIYGCNFYDVDERGGSYHNGTGPDNDRLSAPESYYDNCTLLMTPMVEPSRG
jgi:hypothetical protein